MADTADTTDASQAADQTSVDSTASTDQGTAPELTLEERLAAAQKVNKDLERKLQRSDDNRDRVTTLEAQLAKLEGKEAEYAAAQEQQRTKDEALAEARKLILSAEVRAAAAGKLADPADALLYIDLSSLEVGDDGAVDGPAITAAVTNLVTAKPYLAVQDGRRFQGGADAGARKESAPDLDQQIADATKAGNHALAISLKRQRAYASTT